MPTKKLWKLLATTSLLLWSVAILAQGILPSPLLAGDGAAAGPATGSADGSAKTSTSLLPSSVPAESPAATSPPTSPAPLLAELEELKQTVQAQALKVSERADELRSEQAAVLARTLDRITRLEVELGASTALASSAPVSADPRSTSPPTSPPTPVPTTARAVPQDQQTQGSVDKRLSNLESRLKNIGPLSFSGDFRFREESFWNGPADRSLDQNRFRVRIRFNTDVDLGSGLTGGFTLASGDVNNPISTNQDITAFYTRKPIEIDKAFVQYNPTFFAPLTLAAGKFTYPWFNTELTWDKDLNPEGLSQTLAFNLKSVPVLKRIAVVGFELPFAQVSGVSLQNKSLVQSITYGAQVQTTWQLAPWATLSVFEGFYDFHNADPIALALAKANAKNPVTPLNGALPLSAGSTTQNSITTTTAAGTVTVNGTAAPTGVSTITNAQFNSKFALFDSIARLDIKTRSSRWPIIFLGDFVQNTEACANVGNILAAPANPATAKYSQSTNFACDPSQRHAYWGEVEVGRILEKHDWQFGYTRMFIEREAVLSNFNYSEIRQGTNVSQHRATVFYTVKNNVVLDFIALIGRPLNQSKPKPAEPFLDRLQFDVNYAF